MARGARKPVVRVSAFWDASALIPLCVHQGITPQCVALFKIHPVVVWWATGVEIASGIARLDRMKQITTVQKIAAQSHASKLADTWSVVEPSNAVRSRAIKLIQQYDLRAGDSLQLAAALTWCQDIPTGRVFLTGDGKLREAATMCGFNAPKI